MKKIIAFIISLCVTTALFAFENAEGFAISGSLTIPFVWEHDSWNNISKTTKSSGVGGELQGRFKPYGLPFGLYAQLGINQPRKLSEKRSSTTLTSKASDYTSIYSVDFQSGVYFLAYESDIWFIPFGLGFHYKLDKNEVANIETQTNMFGIGSFIHAEYTLSDCLSSFIGADVSYDFYGGSRRESSTKKSTTVYYNDTGTIKSLSFTPKIGLVFHMR